MLDAEVALARACADVGLVPVEHADAIAAAGDAARYDPDELGRSAAAIGNPAGPLVRALTAAVGDPAAGSVHLGATSQDVLDTATMLVAGRVLDAVLADLAAAAAMVADLAARHAGTVQVGRTLLQHAPPVTFGLTAAGWLAGLDAAGDALRRVRSERLAVQLGGAVGTLAVFGADGPRVLAAMSGRLGLAEPTLPWHTERSRVAELAAAMAQTCGAVAAVARDVVLLAQAEVGEVSEEGPAGSGGSSTLPHKRNPIAAVSALAAAAQAPGLAATLFAAMAHEHQRAAGAWHAEWRPLRELMRCTGSAVWWLRTGLERLRVHPDRMRANLGLTGGLVLAERVTAELAPIVGRLAAHDAVTACCARAAAAGVGAAGPAEAADAGAGAVGPDADTAADVADRPDADTAADVADRASGVADAMDGAGVADAAGGTAGVADAMDGATGTGEGAEFLEVLAADPVVGRQLSRHRIAELLDPDGYLGAAAGFVGRALAEHERRVTR